MKGRLPRDTERISRIARALKAANLDALVCTLGSNVLLVSGYWPVLGNAIAMCTREGAVAVVAPEDEMEFAERSWADHIFAFAPGSLEKLTNTLDSVPDALCRAVQFTAGRKAVNIGHDGSGFDPSSYAATFRYGAAIDNLLGGAFPGARRSDASDILAELRSVLSIRELGLIRQACSIARAAFVSIAAQIRPGKREYEIAALLRSGLMDCREARCDGFAYCMSGPNSAKAAAAYQHTGMRTVRAGDAVLIHCNSYCSGFWTDITRTYFLKPCDAEQQAAIDAVFTASRAAIGAVKAGVKARDVDEAARRVLRERGFGGAFKHATGHGVGFAAIHHDAKPRVHPASEDVLESGMVFNIEPAVYIAEKWGIRQCDMVAVTPDGAELLTSFQNDASALVI
ncbi:MAG TPA: Xaa-Pro peptidase family protein [Bryobacteraceae bacterium]|nr:Xaa-Pro peptidase family protein [Bryobacteraceae bacterium]